MRCDNDRLANYLFRELILTDSYRIRQFANVEIDTILDIGANIGMFSMMARVLFPRARIIAIEPCQDTYDMLVENVRYLDIETVKSALGDGSVLQLSQQSNSGKNMFVAADENATDTIKSVPLEAMASQYLKESKRFILKIDCEGGETCMLKNKPANRVVQRSVFTTMEVHFPTENLKSGKFSSLPPASAFVDWANKFHRTHAVRTKMNQSSGTGMVMLKDLKYV